MAGEALIFRDVAYVLVAAVLGGAVAWAAGQPLILGYVLGGILISPFTPGPAVSDTHTFEIIAEVGVILLMYSVGMEFSPSALLEVKWVALLGAPLGILLSIGLGMLVGVLLGWPLVSGAMVGMVISVASTMVLARLLADRGELQSQHGRVMIGLTLVEDLAVVVLTILIPVFGELGPDRLVDVALAQAVGLSLALGAFLAGLLVSSSEHAHAAMPRLLPLRDAFVALFFVTIGTLIDPRSVISNLPLLGVMLALVVVGKLVIWALVVRLFRYPMRTALLVAVGLTQIGEFSFILVQAARSAGHIGDDVYSATLAAALISILVNAALVRYAPGWLGLAPSPSAA